MIVECPSCSSRYDVTGRPPGTRARCRCGTIFALPDPDGADARQAGMLACPKCGGDVAATNHDCEYCGAALLVMACPRCFARIFHGSRHCRHCGAGVTAPARSDPDGDATPRTCPRCVEPQLIAQLVGDVLLDECPRCHGAFVDVTALERILSERRQARADAILGRAKGGLDDLLVQPEGPMYVTCPDCGATMSRRMFARGAKVIVDVCRDHGTWFDTDELPRVIQFVMDGGLERAALKDADARLEEARAAKARVAYAPSIDHSGHGVWAAASMSSSSGALDALGMVAGVIRRLFDR